MAAPAQLTPGAVAELSENADTKLQPVLQVLDLRTVNNNSNPNTDRFRMVLSDGVHTLQSMLATAENVRVRDGSIRKGSIIHLQSFTCSTIKQRRITIVIKLDVLQSECDIIGNPKPYEMINQPNEQVPNLPANAAQANSGTYSTGPGMQGSLVAPRPAQVADNVPYRGSYGGYPGTVAPPIEMSNQPNEQVPNLTANAAQANSGTYSSGPGMQGSSVPSRPAQVANNVPYGGSYGGYLGTVVPPIEMSNQPNEQVPNLPANAAQSNSGTCSSGPSMQGSSVAPRPAQVSNNVPYGGSYGGNLGTVVPPISRALESVPNVASGVSYGTGSSHNTVNMGMVQPNSQQSPLNSHQHQRFAVPSMAGGSGTPGNTYSNHARPFYQQPPPGHVNRAPVSKFDASRLVPVAKLNPYLERWTIKARVIAKQDLRHYSNPKGAGKVFSFDLLDGQGGEIRATCFNAQADQFFDLIEVDKVYMISRGTLKEKQKKFNPLNHEYEISVDFRTSIEVCPDDDSNIPRQQYNFRQISEIENIEIGAIVDLVGIVTSVNPSATITRKDGTEVQKRTLRLRDMSGRSVEITLWGKFSGAEGQQLQSQCDSGLNPVLALKGGRVTEFSGRSVGSISTTQLKIDPDIPEAESLRHWYATEGKTAACVSLSVVSMDRTDVRKTVAQIKDENLGRSEKPDWIYVKGTISHVTIDNFCYPACTMEVNGRLCNKKVINNGDGTWHCDKCDQSLPKCEYRYMLNCQIQDHTGVTYITVFQEAGIEMIGCSAQELYDIKEEDPERFTEMIQAVRWHQFLFKMKVYEDYYNDEHRVKCSIMKAEKLDPAIESSYLLGVIDGLFQNATGSPSEVGDPMAYTVGLNNTGAGRSVPTPNSNYTTNMSGPRYGESAQQANTYGEVSTPMSATRNVQTCMSCGSNEHNAENCPVGMYRPQPAASTTSSSYRSPQPGNAASRSCFKCKQPGHFAASCPLVGAAPQQQYRSGDALAGGYGRPQPATTNY